MSKKIKNIDNENGIFREIMRGVKPLVHTKIIHSPPKPPAKLRKPQPEESTTHTEHFSDIEKLPLVEGEDLLFFSRPGIQHKILRNLRRGKYNIEASLDLHGKTVNEARDLLSKFLLNCQQNNIRHVLVIHGKGRIDHKPILKNKLNHWLRQTNQVLAFSSALVKDGHSGALYVLLKAQ